MSCSMDSRKVTCLRGGGGYWVVGFSSTEPATTLDPGAGAMSVSDVSFSEDVSLNIHLEVRKVDRQR